MVFFFLFFSVRAFFKACSIIIYVPVTIWSVRSDFFCCSFSISTSNLWNAPIMKTFIFCVYQSSVSSATPTYIGHPERYSCRLLVWHMRKKSRWAREVGMCCWQKILSEKCREVIWLQVLTIYQILSMYFQGAHQNTFLWQTLLLQLSWGKIAVRRKISCKCFYQIDLQVLATGSRETYLFPLKPTYNIVPEQS